VITRPPARITLFFAYDVLRSRSLAVVLVGPAASSWAITGAGRHSPVVVFELA
jgi:hypothetical protein